MQPSRHTVVGILQLMHVLQPCLFIYQSSLSAVAVKPELILSTCSALRETGVIPSIASAIAVLPADTGRYVLALSQHFLHSQQPLML